MRIACEVVKDLLPLYHDRICSDNSRTLVEEHLSECGDCKNEMERLKNNTLDRRIQMERNDVVGHHAQAVKRKSLVAGISIASVMAVPILVCLIVNLSTGHSLDWFFIVLTSLMTFSSVTVIPLIMESRKGLWTLGCFTVSLILLLLTTCLYSGGNWFFLAVIPILFGLSVLFAPFVINAIPLKGFAARNKGLFAMTVDSILLFAIITVSGLFNSYSMDYWRPALMVTVVCLLFPWVLFLIIRYLKANSFIKAGLSTIFGGVFLSMLETVLYWITEGIFRTQFRDANLLAWNQSVIEANIFLLILLAGILVGGVLLTFGLMREKCLTSNGDKAP